MDSLTRMDELLTRAVDGVATDEERAALDATARLDLEALAGLHDSLRQAVRDGPRLDVVDAVMEAVEAEARWAPVAAALRDGCARRVELADAVMAALDADAAWGPLGSAVKDAVAAPPVDLAGDILDFLAAEETWAPHGQAVREALAEDVDLADDVLAALGIDDGAGTLGESLRGATARRVDLWAGIADAIGEDPHAVHGWDDVAEPLRAAVRAAPPIDVADAVLAAVAAPKVVALDRAPPAAPRRRMPLWASLAPVIGLAAAAAAALVFYVTPAPAPGTVVGSLPTVQAPVATNLQLAAVNQADVEDISGGKDVVVQVMQFEDGGPTFILVDDPSGSGVPL